MYIKFMNNINRERYNESTLSPYFKIIQLGAEDTASFEFNEDLGERVCRVVRRGDAALSELHILMGNAYTMTDDGATIATYEFSKGSDKDWREIKQASEKVQNRFAILNLK